MRPMLYQTELSRHKIGWTGRDRTFDYPVNSREFYLLNYRPVKEEDTSVQDLALFREGGAYRGPCHIGLTEAVGPLDLGLDRRAERRIGTILRLLHVSDHFEIIAIHVATSATSAATHFE